MMTNDAIRRIDKLGLIGSPLPGVGLAPGQWPGMQPGRTPRPGDSMKRYGNDGYHDSSFDKHRGEWNRSFKNRFGSDIDSSSAAHCVPKRLLAGMIANEMTDWDGLDGGPLDGISNGGIGPAQISVDTAIKNNLYPNLNDKGTLKDALKSDAGAVEAAATLLRQYIEDLCKRRGCNGAGPGAKNSFADVFKAGQKGATKSLCEALGDCQKMQNMKPDAALLAAMGARWNSDSVWDAQDTIGNDNYGDPYRNGLDAGMLAPQLDSFINQ
jgi:hypothetical protein